MAHELIAELQDITKIFPGVTALDHMHLQLRAGEVHGLIGENGAGKSTLIKVLTGLHRPEEGVIRIHGKEIQFSDPIEARSQGIACVYQELNIVPELSVADNLFLGNYKKRKNSCFLDESYMYKKTREIMSMIDSEIDPAAKCCTLGMGQQQMIEIGKAILFEAQVVILDEPTSSLGERETQELFRIIRLLKEKGTAILFVSHRLEEIFELCDVVTVMRDSQHVVTLPTAELTRDLLISHMVGRTLANLFPKQDTTRGAACLEAKHLTRAGMFHDISFCAYRGELLGFAGLVGAKRTELMRAIFAADPLTSGEIRLNGKTVRFKNPNQSVASGIALLPEDRKTQGLVLNESISKNICLIRLPHMKRGLFIDDAQVRQCAQKTADKLQIKTSSIQKPAGQLSGGNQQKVVIGKWMNTEADIYIFDEPTRGIDIGAKIEVYNIMNELLQRNKCVIMVSSELPEILGMCDRVIVMREGRITADIMRSSHYFTQEGIMDAAWGRSLTNEKTV